MDEVLPIEAAGKIIATPNPLRWDAEVPLTLQWEASPPQQVEIFVSESGAEEKLVRRGGSGSCELEWIRPGIDYEFFLYGNGRRKLDSVTVRRDPIPWKALRAHLGFGTQQTDEEAAEMAEFIAQSVSLGLRNSRFPEWFRLWETHGFHVSPVHFYEPMPDTRALGEELWEKRYELEGVDLNRGIQLDFLRKVFPQFQREWSEFPVTLEEAKGGFYLGNNRFGNLDPLIAYCMVRHFRPSRIVEIGGGYSTLLLALAARRNENTTLTCIEPYPDEPLRADIPGLEALIQTRVEHIGLSFFEELKAGDVLFIDSSHTTRIGGDVNYLFLEVIPHLRPGVIVHVHDIFFPFEYPRKWAMEQHRFWTEQYMLQAFLAFNAEFEVLAGATYLTTCWPEEVQATFPNTPELQGASFWMRRRIAAEK